MCIIFTLIRPSPEFKFALMMDRDESFLRDTSCLRFRPELGVFCGLDSVKGGTWLAIDLKGRFVAITNVRSSTVINASTTSNTSRGIIPLTLLKQETFDPTEWKHVIESTECENFNVLFGDLSLDIPEICKYSSETRELVKISDGGVYSLANSDLQLDKQRKGKKLIRDLLSTNSLTESSLFSVLKNDERFSEDAEDFTKWPIFVRCNKTRGTVSSTVLMLDYEGKVEFIERSWTESGELKQESRETFAIE